MKEKDNYKSNTAVYSGLKVLDLTQYISGPYCTKLLAESGAEVLKVEKPGEGDIARREGPFYHDEPGIERSGLFMYLNTGKKDITLDIRKEAGKSIMLKLIDDTDIVVENFKPGFLERLGLGYEAMKKRNHDLIMASISNFGQTGKYRDYEATEIVLLALSGVLYTVGPYEQPVRYTLSQSQYMAGVHAATAIGASIFARGRGNSEGDHIDVAIVESLMSYMAYFGCYYTYMGAIRGRLTKEPDIVDMLVPTKDGYVAPLVYGYVNWEDFPAMLDCPELANPKFADFKGRHLHIKELSEILTREFAKWNKTELVSLAQDFRFPFGMVQTTEDVVKCPQLQERDYFVSIDHPVTGKLAYPGAPYKVTGMAFGSTQRAPLLGEHNEEIFCRRLGYSKEDMVLLREQGVI